MYHYWQFNRADFLQHYHKRSNVEFHLLNDQGEVPRSRPQQDAVVAMVNEVLCKIICHNICCLIQESHELGIETVVLEGGGMSEPVTFSGGGQSEFAGQSFVVRQITGRSLVFWLQAAEIRTTATLILDDGQIKSFDQRQDLPAKSDQRVLDDFPSGRTLAISGVILSRNFASCSTDSIDVHCR